MVSFPVRLPSPAPASVTQEIHTQTLLFATNHELKETLTATVSLPASDNSSDPLNTSVESNSFTKRPQGHIITGIVSGLVVVVLSGILAVISILVCLRRKKMKLINTKCASSGHPTMQTHAETRVDDSNNVYDNTDYATHPTTGIKAAKVAGSNISTFRNEAYGTLREYKGHSVSEEAVYDDVVIHLPAEPVLVTPNQAYGTTTQQNINDNNYDYI